MGLFGRLLDKMFGASWASGLASRRGREDGRRLPRHGRLLVRAMIPGGRSDTLARHYAANAPSELSLIAVHHRKFVELADCVSRALASGYRATDLCLSLLNVPPKFNEMRLATANMRDGIDVMRKGSPHACKTPQDLVRSTWPIRVPWLPGHRLLGLGLRGRGAPDSDAHEP